MEGEVPTALRPHLQLQRVQREGEGGLEGQVHHDLQVQEEARPVHLRPVQDLRVVHVPRLRVARHPEASPGIVRDPLPGGAG